MEILKNVQTILLILHEHKIQISIILCLICLYWIKVHIRQITRVIKKIKLVLSPREKGNNEHLSNLKLIALQTIAKISK